MNFEQVLKAILSEFEEKQIRYAVTGGFAVGALGVPRATMDVDFLVHSDDLPVLDASMNRLGYRCGGRTENVSRYIHAEAAWGRIDCLHAFRKYTLAMLARAQQQQIFGGAQRISVLQPEDVIGLKVQAIANDPLRRGQDQVDIEALADRYREHLRWDRVQEYYVLFHMEEEGRRLQEQFGHAE